MEIEVSLAEWRERRGMSQAQLARALGVARSTILRWESGQYPIERPAALKMALERLEETVQTYYVAFSRVGGTVPMLARGEDPESTKQAAYAQIDRLFPRSNPHNATLRKNLDISPRSKLRLDDVIPEAEE